ncbi:coiled-coil domain-containing protein 172 [Ambystoma mexicanum]|uniref:coiled-coil domain-containing protein 172 n=1 Tax=Ambystoma mexicanum TaxID=8296 RepID=UPI0037E795C6
MSMTAGHTCSCVTCESEILSCFRGPSASAFSCFRGAPFTLQASAARWEGRVTMSLDSLFQQILYTEQQAQEKRRLMHEVKLATKSYHEKIKAVTEELSEARVELDLKVQDLSEKLFHQRLLKKRQEVLEEQRDHLEKERKELLTVLEDLEKATTKEQNQFMKELCDFNNEYALTNDREHLLKKQAQSETSELEVAASALRNEMERMEHEHGHLNALQMQKDSLKAELVEHQLKLNDIEDELNKAIMTTKYLEEERVKVSQKPQSDPECLRLKSELEIFKDEDLDQVHEALRAEVEFLQMKLSQKTLQLNK